MCELLGMNCALPTDIRFSFSGFSQRSGNTGDHIDGFGIAFFERHACRLFIDTAPALTSPIAALVQQYPIKSTNVIAHIRKATQGEATLENVHPFMRELWGRHWIFAHNGDLKQFSPLLNDAFQPVGTTDSERAYCLILSHLRQTFGQYAPTEAEVFACLADFVPCIARFGTFNFLLSNGDCLFAYGTTHLHWLIREYPFKHAHLIDTDMDIDFSQHATPHDRVAVIATQPLTDNEEWTAFKAGELIWFNAGMVQQIHQTAYIAPDMPAVS